MTTHWNLYNQTSEESEIHIASNIHKQKAIIVSDGYFKDRWVTAALIIEVSQHGVNLI